MKFEETMDNIVAFNHFVEENDIFKGSANAGKAKCNINIKVNIKIMLSEKYETWFVRDTNYCKINIGLPGKYKDTYHVEFRTDYQNFKIEDNELVITGNSPKMGNYEYRISIA